MANAIREGYRLYNVGINSNGPTETGTWTVNYSHTSIANVSSTTDAVLSYNISRSNKIKASVWPTDNSSLFCSSNSDRTSGIFFDIKTVNSNKMIVLRAIDPGISTTNDSVLSFSTELPWPSDYSLSEFQTFELSQGTYGWSVSILHKKSSVQTSYVTGSAQLFLYTNIGYKTGGKITVETSLGEEELTYTSVDATGAYPKLTGLSAPVGTISQGARVQIWRKIISLPFKSVASYSSSLIKNVRSSSNTYCGVFCPTSGSAVEEIYAYSIPEYGYSPSTNGSVCSLFSDNFNRTESAYNIANSTGNGTTYFSTSSQSSNFSCNGSNLVISNGGGFLINKKTNISWPASSDLPITLIKFVYTSGTLGFYFSNAGGYTNYSVRINSSSSGSTYPVTLYSETETFDSKGGSLGLSYSGEVGTSATGTPVKANTSGTTIASGSTVWIVLYPTLTSDYPPQLNTAYKIAIYVQSATPKYSDVPTMLSANPSPVSIITDPLDCIYLFSETTTSTINSLDVQSLSMEYFVNPGGIAANYGVPLTHPNSISTAPSLSSTELVAGVYLGTDYVYETTEAG